MLFYVNNKEINSSYIVYITVFMFLKLFSLLIKIENLELFQAP